MAYQAGRDSVLHDVDWIREMLDQANSRLSTIKPPDGAGAELSAGAPSAVLERWRTAKAELAELGLEQRRRNLDNTAGHQLGSA